MSEIQYVYNHDQRVSLNAFVEVEVDGEFYKVQVTARHGAPAQEIVDDFNQMVDALAIIGAQHPVSTPKLVSRDTQTKSTSSGYQSPRAENVPARLDQSREWFVDDFDWAVVEPLPDGKGTIKF